MKRFVLLNCIVMLSFLFVSAVRADDRDQGITDAVTQKLLTDETTPAAAIDVSTKDGVVTLKGKVIGSKEADRAVELARAVPGVVKVNSELKVDTHITNSDVKDRLETREETTEKQQELKEKNHPEDHTLLGDSAITASVKMKLAKDEIGSLYRIDVDTKDGVVTLTGTVKSEGEAQRLTELAKTVDGVKRVSSVLTVKP